MRFFLFFLISVICAPSNIVIIRYTIYTLSGWAAYLSGWEGHVLWDTVQYSKIIETFIKNLLKNWKFHRNLLNFGHGPSKQSSTLRESLQSPPPSLLSSLPVTSWLRKLNAGHFENAVRIAYLRILRQTRVHCIVIALFQVDVPGIESGWNPILGRKLFSGHRTRIGSLRWWHVR